jgi:hypothetical protein
LYCSSCGVAIAANLTYCNFCGAKVNSEKTDTLGKDTELRYDAFIMTVMVFLFVLGLVAISVLLGVMKSVLNFEFGPLIAFAFLSIFILLGLEGILISRLFRRKNRPEKSGGSARPATHITRELEAQSRVMGEPVSSVTEHTTRTLDPVPRVHT